jgi:hypothetical protein
MTAPTTQRAQTEHWAIHSHGFRVCSGKKKVGFVTDVIPPHGEVEGALVVRGGLFKRRLFLVPLDDVESSDRRRWLVRICEPSHPSDPKLLEAWLRRRKEALTR